MTRAEDDAAMAQVLAAADTTLGIIAGLTIAVASSHAQHADGGTSDDNGDGKGHSSPSASPSAGASSAPPPPEASGDSPRRGKAAPSGKRGANAAAPGLRSVQEQRDAIRRLQEHNQLLKAELAIEQRDARALLATDKRARLSELQRSAALFARKVALAQRKLSALELQVQQRRQELEALRQQRLPPQHGLGEGGASGGGASHASPAAPTDKEAVTVAAEPSAASAARRLRALENRLELSLVKKNEIESVNKHLFARIDKVRRDRVIFDGIYKKLEREASDSRQRHAQAAAELERARAARLAVAAEVERVQAEAEAEQRDFERQFLDLRREIEAWMRVHGGDTDALALGPPIAPAAAAAGHAGGPAGDLHAPSASVAAAAATAGKKSALARVAARSTWKIGLERALGSDADAQVARYDAAFREIRRVTGLRDTRALCEELLARDDANFQRFRRVEELSREQVALQAQLAALAAQTDDYKARAGIASGAAQKQQLRAAQRRLEALGDGNRELELEADALQTAFARVKSSVHSVHNLLVHSAGAKGASTGPGGGGGGSATTGAGGMGSGGSGVGSGAGANGGGAGAGASAAPGASASGDSDWLQLGGGGATALPMSAREVTETNVLEYLRAIEMYASRLAVQSAVHAEADAAAATGDGAASTAASPSRSAGAMALPLGHGPATLPSDPKQKLQVQVPSFGGLNGVIVLPPRAAPAQAPAAAPLSRSPTRRSILVGQAPAQLGPSASPPQQQLLNPQLKKGSKFELYSRKSLSQQQFAAALAAAASTAVDGNSSSDASAPAHPDRALASESQPHHPHHFPTHQRLPTAERSAADDEPDGDEDEDEEEERALTYDELRQFAAKNLSTRRRSRD